VLKWVEQRGVLCLNAPQDIAVMFDKWECHRHFVKHEVTRPPAELAPTECAEFFAYMRAKGCGRRFLKPLHGSSASGVCALRWTPERQQLIGPFRIQTRNGKPMLINSLSVRTYTSFADIEMILALLLPQGMICEEWIPKLTLPGGAVDLRVLVIAGEARHWVIRQSRHPMTNLHLGNQRGDAAALENCIGLPSLDAAFRLAEQAAACFPNSLYAGVDILLDTQHRALVGEINAFGDLLPRLLHRGNLPTPPLPKPAMLQVVLFDLDNTLVDRDAAFLACIQAQFSDAAVRAQLLKLDHSGRGDRTTLFSYWKKQSGNLMDQAQLGEHIAKRIQPDQGLIQELQFHSKTLQLGLITNGSSSTQRQKIRAAHLNEVFSADRIWISAEVGKAKPDPAIFLCACEVIGVAPANCLFVGDHEQDDLRGAMNAGLRARLVDSVLDASKLNQLLGEEAQR
jgi:HAD superfamily hydrolase (TIGR01509 family)